MTLHEIAQALLDGGIIGLFLSIPIYLIGVLINLLIKFIIKKIDWHKEKQIITMSITKKEFDNFTKGES